MNPLDYDLDKEYRQRQMIHSDNVRQIDALNYDRQDWTFYRLKPIFMTVMSIITIVVVFFACAKPIQAQEATSLTAGEDGDTNSTVYAYLYSTILAIQEEDFTSASDYMDEALTIVPNFVPAYITHSYVALAEGDAELALENAEIALEINPNDGAVYFVLAEAHFALANYEEAQGYYEIYLEMVDANGRQPILITSFLNADSLRIVSARLACIAEILA